MWVGLSRVIEFGMRVSYSSCLLNACLPVSLSTCLLLTSLSFSFGQFIQRREPSRGEKKEKTRTTALSRCRCGRAAGRKCVRRATRLVLTRMKHAGVGRIIWSRSGRISARIISLKSGVRVFLMAALHSSRSSSLSIHRKLPPPSRRRYIRLCFLLLSVFSLK